MFGKRKDRHNRKIERDNAAKAKLLKDIQDGILSIPKVYVKQPSSRLFVQSKKEKTELDNALIQKAKDKQLLKNAKRSIYA
jgi:hypothetical protein